MYKALSPRAIGVQAAALAEAIEAARQGGFAGVEFDAREVAGLVEREGADAIRARFRGAGLRPAGWGLPVDWRGAEEGWRRGLDELPRLAAAATAIGCQRAMTVVMPCSDDRAFEENWRFHIERLTPVAAALAEQGCALGLEFIGPKTLREKGRFPFVHTLGGMLDLGAAIGPNVGLLLDCWHWHTSHGTLDELRALRPEQVVYVHVNDAPAGVPTDEQLDQVRALPGETGVIDIAGFLQALHAIGYDGPITPEPFSADLRALPSDAERLRVVGAAMDTIFRQAGLA